MDLEPDDSQAALRDELRRFLADRVTPDARRAIAERPGAVDPALWGELVALGAFTLASAWPTPPSERRCAITGRAPSTGWRRCWAGEGRTWHGFRRLTPDSMPGSIHARFRRAR